jgi:hypothetical protein
MWSVKEPRRHYIPRSAGAVLLESVDDKVNLEASYGEDLNSIYDGAIFCLRSSSRHPRSLGAIVPLMQRAKSTGVSTTLRNGFVGDDGDRRTSPVHRRAAVTRGSACIFIGTLFRI